MPALYRFYGFPTSDKEWRSTLGGRTIEECRKLLLMVGEEDAMAPITLRLFGYDCYAPGRRLVRVAKPYIVRYVVSGRGIFNGVPITRGDCYVSVPGRKYVIESDADEPLIHYWFEMLGGKAPLYAERLFGSSEPGVYHIDDIAQCEQVFYDLMFEDHPETELATYCYSVFFHLLAIHRKGRHNAEPVSKTMTMYLEAVDYIETHYAQQIKVSDLCERLHIVPDYLYKIFKRYSGLSTQEYIINSRMNMAAVLLATTEDPIGEIACTVGYSEPGRFTRTFRSVYGQKPSEYRKSKKEKMQKNVPNPTKDEF